MTAERFQQLRNLFEAALEREPAARKDFLDEASSGDHELRQEACRLLAAHESTTRLIEESVPAVAVARTDPLSREGGRVGPYEILRELGRGGMGTVYLARRADEAFQKLVAVKILRADIASEELIRRFQREREILAALEHPNIARLLDAGKTDDRLPYFVMEYVEGISILTYSDQAMLPVPERLRLYRQLCEAVSYAHRQGVIHRDLKPGNILVSKGQVKVLDFGIARLVRGESPHDTLTEASLVMMTPQYASPEQVRGEPATRQSDVYSLGVILYELITGHSPYQLRSRVYHEIVRVVCEEEPARPSVVVANPIEVESSPSERAATVPPETAGRLRQASLDEWKGQLRGNLDAVVLKTLSKRPEDRYNSPEQLGEDLDRHLKGDPVWARDIVWWQRAGMILSRHRGTVIGSAAVAGAVMGGAVNLHWTAILYALAAAFLFLLWYAATDRELGRRIAGSFLTSRKSIFIFALLASVPFIRVTHSGYIPPVMVDLGLLAMFLVGLGFFVAWLFRERWTGPLLVDFTTRTPLWIVLLIAYTADAVTSMVDVHQGKVTLLAALGKDAVRLTLVLAIYLSGKREIRQAGILRGGHLLRWSRIRSWSWTEEDNLSLTKRSEFLFLTLELHRSIQFLPPVRLQIKASQREALGAVIARHLGDWPDPCLDHRVER